MVLYFEKAPFLPISFQNIKMTSKIAVAKVVMGSEEWL